MERKLTFDEVLESIHWKHIDRSDVQASALRRKVWVAEWHLPGCLSETAVFVTTKADAIDAACSMAEDEHGIPRGMKQGLRTCGQFNTRSPLYGTVINTISQRTLADLL